ncbi:MAG: PepSY domain-containing protein [Proteobacteria bacterium]|nr:PepSY domain-containing protein [Pseudomonadota bacterium]
MDARLQRHAMLKKWHRRLGLGLAFFWLVQAASGVGIELAWWLDGLQYRDVDAPPRAQVLERSLEALRAEGATVASMWSAGTVASQAKVFYSNRVGQFRMRRIDSAGGTLYDERTDARWTHEGLMRTVSDLHKTILIGTAGQMLVAVSGVFLVLSLALGVQLALRGRARLRQVLLWQPVKALPARRFQTHRMFGAWFAIPALALATTGALLAVTEGWESIRPGPVAAAPAAMANTSADAPASVPAGASPAADITPARAIELALARIPGSRLSALVLPGATDAAYTVWVRAPDETRRFWGTTRVHVAVRGGAIDILRSDALPLVDHTAEVIYPFHTGQFGGLAMRLIAMFLGLGLLLTAVYGLLLWNARRARSRPQPT